MPTLLGQPSPLMRFQLLSIPLSFYRSIALRFRIVQHHRLIKQLKALHLFYGASGGFGVFEDDEGLAFGFEVWFDNKIDDISIFGEDFSES